MRSIKPVVASNGFAILLKVVFLLPTTAIFLYILTSPIDTLASNIGLWLHAVNEWPFPEFDTKERLGGTLSSILFNLSQGVQIFRVHNVEEIKQGVLVFKKLLNQ